MSTVIDNFIFHLLIYVLTFCIYKIHVLTFTFLLNIREKGEGLRHRIPTNRNLSDS